MHDWNWRLVFIHFRYNFFTGCPKARTCTMILRGGAEQFIEETERSLHDAIMIVRRAIKNDCVVAGKHCNGMLTNVFLVFRVNDERPVVIDSLKQKLRQMRDSSDMILDEMLSAKCRLLQHEERPLYQVWQLLVLNLMRHYNFESGISVVIDCIIYCIIIASGRKHNHMDSAGNY